MTVSREWATIYRQTAIERAAMEAMEMTQLTRSTDALDFQSIPRPVAAMAKSFEDGHLIAAHRHDRAQLVYAVSGVMTIDAAAGTWLVPPDRALWIPAGVLHEIRVSGRLDMRTLYLRADASAHLPDDCVVLAVTPLLRELVVRATQLPALYPEDGPAGSLMNLILAEIRELQALPLHLPIPRDRRLARLCNLVRADLAANRTRDDYATVVGISPRSLSRLFRSELGVGFASWRRRARLLSALARLQSGESITSVALGLGYESPSAFTAMFKRELGMLPSRYLK